MTRSNGIALTLLIELTIDRADGVSHEFTRREQIGGALQMIIRVTRNDGAVKRFALRFAIIRIGARQDVNHGIDG
jgi:hypothetical protein